ncbi:unnamed protein product [Leptidea sinapis]|uniref:Uncharacterized protein n=1 Tax=Leptidea sinapis TaxID=189913 RepID=A0A5E4R316_9NEOP|nr:unnamed protein product [Leptidea sinapis]
MGSIRPPGRFLSFGNNIQRTQKQIPSNFHQSLSGSETDVSTSNENLSREERYVDSVPGSNRNSLKDSVGGSNSNRSSLDVSSSSYNTLIIHNQDDSWTSRPTPIREHERTSSEVKHTNVQSPYHTIKKTDVSKKASGIPLPKIHKPQEVITSANYIDIGGQRIYTSPPDHRVQEITEIPDDFLNQSSVLKHLAKEAAQSPTPHGTTPPPSPKNRDERVKGKPKAKLSKEKLNLSRSQPDLTNVGVRAVPGGSESSGWCSGGEGDPEVDGEGDAFTAVLDALAAENHQLKRQLADACERRGLCCFPGLGTVGTRAGSGRGEEALLLERQGRASQQTRSSSLPPPPSALPRPPRKPSTRNAPSRSSPLPYDAVRKLPSVPTSASLPAAESRESLVRPRDSSLPSPSKLAVYAAARRRSAESAKDAKRTHHYRIQF